MLLYGGVELLFPDQDGELAKWLREHQNLEDMVDFGEPRLAEISPRRGLQSWYGVRKGIGQTVANYPKAPKPRLNTLYWPTGATRWARGFFLATGASKEKIVAQAHAAGNVPLKLTMGEDGMYVQTNMYLLPPRVVARQANAAEALWILPLVDVRYWWQNRSTDDLEVTTSTTWASLFSTLATKLGTSVSMTAPIAAYLQPDPIEFTRRYENAAAMLDAAALSVGKRIVRHLDGTVRALSAEESAIIHDRTNFRGTWQQICGGGDSLPKGSLPATVVTSFRKWRDYALLARGRVYTESQNAPVGTIVAAGTKRTIHSTAFANCTDSDSSPSNTSELNALAVVIGNDAFAWMSRTHDYTFAGVKPWYPSGFDDAVEFAFGYQGPSGKCQAQTRVQSLPHDFGFDLQLSQFADMGAPLSEDEETDRPAGLFEPVMRGKPVEAIAAGERGIVKIWTGRADSKTESDFEVYAYSENGAEQDKFYTVRWIEDDWEIDEVGSTGIVQFTTTEYMAESIPGAAEGTLSWEHGVGVPSGDTVLLYHVNSQFPDVHSGAKGTAIYDVDLSSEEQRAFRIISSQRVAKFAEATISESLCPDADPAPTTVAISGFAVLPCGDEVGAPPTTPTVANIGTIHAGTNGDKVKLRRVNNTMPNPTWEIIAIDKHLVENVVDVTWDGTSKIRQGKVKQYVELCDPTETTTDVVEFEEC